MENIIRFGPAGRCCECTDFTPLELANFLKNYGLNAFEYSCGRGVRISSKMAVGYKNAFEAVGVTPSVHAPYFINLANPDIANSATDKKEKNLSYLADSAKAVKAMGGNRVVFHPGSPCKLQYNVALDVLRKNLDLLLVDLEKEGVIFCAETMGKASQIGSVKDIISICNQAPFIYPCVDFGHLHTRDLGILKAKQDYRKVIEAFFDGVGEEKTKNMHIHFSKIQYGAKGELRHLTFDDQIFGPNPEPLLELIAEYKMTPTIICESNGTQAADASTMQKFYEKF